MRQFALVIVINIVILVFIIQKACASEIDEEKKFGRVLHVSAIFRHGDRTPYYTYPKDPYLNYEWPPDGREMLTSRGKKRAYERGKWFRNRYSRLMKKVTSHTNISMISSYLDRTIMSGQCFLAGFWPPNTNQTIDGKLLWQPIPVYSIPFDYDHIIVHSRKCPLLTKLSAQLFDSERVKKIYDKYFRIFRYLEKHSGYEFSRNDMRTVIRRFTDLLDAITVQKEHNMTIPSWTKKISDQTFKAITRDTRRYYLDGNERIIQRLKPGPLLETFIDGMKRKLNGTSQVIFNLYSGHEHTIAYLMIALGFPCELEPPYSASLIFELREKSGENVITIVYSNSTSTSPQFLKIPGCELPCKFEKFLQLTAHLVPVNWDEECKV